MRIDLEKVGHENVIDLSTSAALRDLIIRAFPNTIQWATLPTPILINDWEDLRTDHITQGKIYERYHLYEDPESFSNVERDFKVAGISHDKQLTKCAHPSFYIYLFC